jgi:hypothetical protein
VEASNFDRTRLVTETTLSKYKRDASGMFKNKCFNVGDLSEIALLGAIRRPEKVPELLYSVTCHQPKQKIYNIVQVSGAILGQSRSIFLGLVLSVLRVFCPTMLEASYCGEICRRRSPATGC